MTSEPVAENSTLARPVKTLFGVGPERAALLGKLEIRTIDDLLLYRPRRYEDRHRMRPIAELRVGDPSITHGKVVALGVKWFARHAKSIFELVLEDGTARLHCRWWNLPYMEKYFQRGNEVLVFGKPVQLKPRTIDHPETEVLEGGEENFVHLNRITPIYPLTEGLPQRWLRSLIWRTLQSYEGQVQELFAPPPDLPSRAKAIRMIHFPEAEEQIEKARRRLALDEFVELQLRIQLRRKNFQTKACALPCGGDQNRLIKPFLARLGFKLTRAQTEVLRELRQDMSGPHPMRRLLQGDVGSGKTVVAACCGLMCLESGYSVALMAPTEILAEQHYLNFSKWFRPLGVQVLLQTGSHKPQRSKATNQGSPNRSHTSQPAEQPSLTIGTHALIHAGFAPERLGLVIIDEQHKFGVSQREELVRKGEYPHLLIMTATPIPRTMGLTLYGDLDISTIRELPPGRGRVKTFVRPGTSLPKVWDFVLSRLRDGRQAYVVYPRVEETGANDDIKAVTREFEKLRKKFAPFEVGLLHGRMPAREKEEIMGAFRANQLQVLLATALIEVGVDVPNATLMLIENAEQFGLAQLHQLRGRIGRGAHESYCILVTSARTPEARQRLQVLEQSTDGFEIAEADLKLRGPGELLGQEQSGVPNFRFGDLNTDLALINQAREIAAGLIKTPKADPAVSGNPQRLVGTQMVETAGRKPKAIGNPRSEEAP
jgi:ATP-dependent DNA helicase RecG